MSDLWSRRGGVEVRSYHFDISSFSFYAFLILDLCVIEIYATRIEPQQAWFFSTCVLVFLSVRPYLPTKGYQKKIFDLDRVFCMSWFFCMSQQTRL